jgi:hypothetical protein
MADKCRPVLFSGNAILDLHNLSAAHIWQPEQFSYRLWDEMAVIACV